MAYVCSYKSPVGVRGDPGLPGLVDIGALGGVVAPVVERPPAGPVPPVEFQGVLVDGFAVYFVLVVVEFYLGPGEVEVGGHVEVPVKGLEGGGLAYIGGVEAGRTGGHVEGEGCILFCFVALDGDVGVFGALV